MAVDYTKNEKVIGAFLTCYRAMDIVREANISKNTVYKLKNDPSFQETIRKRKAAILRAAVNKMQGYLVRDVEILQGIIEDDATAPQVKINGISVMLSQLKDLTQTVDITERLDTLQKAFKDGFMPSEGGVDGI